MNHFLYLMLQLDNLVSEYSAHNTDISRSSSCSRPDVNNKTKRTWALVKFHLVVEISAFHLVLEISVLCFIAEIWIRLVMETSTFHLFVEASLLHLIVEVM